MTKLERDLNPEFFAQIQQTAIDFFATNNMHGCQWSSVHIRVTPLGQAYVMDVNPMPTILQPLGEYWDDLAIQQSLPGTHLSLVQYHDLLVLLATRLSRHDAQWDRKRVRQFDR